MSIQHWPETERPREKLLARGPGALSDAELLAIFLHTGNRGQTAVDLARELLRQFGGLRALLRAERHQVLATRGLGPAKYVQLQAALELAKRHLGESLRSGVVIDNSVLVKDYLRLRLRDYEREVFACLFLDTRHRLLHYEELFHGTLDSASVHPREVLVRALALNAAAVILAHNHPSGDAEPSAADRRVTQRLREALGLVEIRVLDHLVVGDRATVSFAERGWL